MKYKVLFTIAGILASGYSYATLGEGTDSVDKDIQVLNAQNNTRLNLVSKNVAVNTSAQLTSQPNYDRYSFTTNDGITVVQYATNNNIFAIKWHGSHIPNLRQLYGSYFPIYQTTKSPYIGTSQRTVETFILKAGVTGISGAFSGYALLKSELPANLKLSDLK